MGDEVWGIKGGEVDYMFDQSGMIRNCLLSPNLLSNSEGFLFVDILSIAEAAETCRGLFTSEIL